ncbi:MAG: 30S ribosomal protein S12 methylthiotransferase RimO [Alistipes sp.]|nr:30S ribosomal protein S12 methylthiotransferase RimO [Alistipes sp.]
MKKINVITLGCSKNTVDSEHLMAQLAEAGYELSFDSDRTDAKVVVINTCGFIGDAKQESIDTILDAVAAKEAGLIERLFVIGCLSERYADELREEIPEVDDYFGVKDWAAIASALGAEHKAELETERVLTTPSHYAYLKISEGCNWLCGYCAIPLIRGKHESVPMEQVLDEARKLAARGVKEIMVIAQDTTYYGIDLYGRRRLADLLRELCRIDGIEWIRLHYAYPAAFPEDVIEVMATEPKICKYLDIPFQHISDHMLSAMKRRHSKAEAMELIARLRERIPDIALRTTLLVGYPGETEADIEELEQFVREVRFERLGVFPYSEEEGTYSAENLKDDVSEEDKQRRADRIMLAQADIAEASNLRYEGRTLRAIVDGREGDYYVARTEYDSPEVDQVILIPTSERRLRRGCFYDIYITGADGYDLYGKVTSPAQKRGR